MKAEEVERGSRGVEKWEGRRQRGNLASGFGGNVITVESGQRERGKKSKAIGFIVGLWSCLSPFGRNTFLSSQ